MQIKIDVSKQEQIEGALSAVNGKAQANTFTKFEHVESEVKAAERKLAALLPLKKDWVGAKFTATSDSGGWRYWSAVTELTLQFKPSGWFLTNVRSHNSKSGYKCELYLTQEQDTKAHELLASKFKVQNAMAVAV
jgi:hypothetical protein